MLHKIEQNALGHFKYLPEIAGFSVTEDGGLTVINCGFGSSMFNIVVGGGDDVSDERIQSIISEFQGQPFAWWVSPQTRSKELSLKLLAHGFVIETTEYAMLCDLSHFNAASEPGSLRIEPVLTLSQLEYFIEALEPYDATARAFYEEMTLEMLAGKERLFVGYENNEPVIIGILYSHDDAAGIFSILTREDKRGRGYGTQMMTYLMNTAKQNGAKYATLSASSDAGYRIYERLGFKAFGEFDCFEWKGG